jgi:putative tricarboxylic transport membrane protein
MDRRIDIVLAAACALLGTVVILQAAGIRIGIPRDPLGPRTAFYVVGGVMVVGGVWVIARHLLKWSQASGHLVRNEGVGDEAGYPASGLRAWALMGLCAFYAFALGPVGFLIGTPIFLLAGLFLLGKREPVQMITISVVFTALTYLIFAEGLGVRLPVGPLTGLFRELGWITL